MGIPRLVLEQKSRCLPTGGPIGRRASNRGKVERGRWWGQAMAGSRSSWYQAKSTAWGHCRHWLFEGKHSSVLFSFLYTPLNGSCVTYRSTRFWSKLLRASWAPSVVRQPHRRWECPSLQSLDQQKSLKSRTKFSTENNHIFLSN